MWNNTWNVTLWNSAPIKNTSLEITASPSCFHKNQTEIQHWPDGGAASSEETVLCWNRHPIYTDLGPALSTQNPTNYCEIKTKSWSQTETHQLPECYVWRREVKGQVPVKAPSVFSHPLLWQPSWQMKTEWFLVHWLWDNDSVILITALLLAVSNLDVGAPR